MLHVGRGGLAGRRQFVQKNSKTRPVRAPRNPIGVERLDKSGELRDGLRGG